MFIYFPSLTEAYTLVETARNRLAPFLRDPNEGRLSTQEFKRQQIEFEKACVTFKSKVSALVYETLG